MNNILITGGTGSLGKALIAGLLKTDCQRIVSLSNSEKEIVDAQSLFKDDRVRFFYGDIRDNDRLSLAIKGCDTVIHTAAMKHVPIGENNPFEMVKSNIIGTQNVISACIGNNVTKLLHISTDKAASPSNLYGATKLCAEKICIDANIYSGKDGTIISAMRFGNFIGSSGSVFDIWQHCTNEYPITDLEVKRYWISLEMAAYFCLRSLSVMTGGEIFIPKMKEAKLADYVKEQPWYSNLPFKVTGLRKGEKLEEILWADHEEVIDNGWCYCIKA